MALFLDIIDVKEQYSPYAVLVLQIINLTVICLYEYLREDFAQNYIVICFWYSTSMCWCLYFFGKFHFTIWSSSSFSTFPSEFNNHIQDLYCTYTFGKVSFHHVEFILFLNMPLEILESSKYSPLFSNFCYFTSNH